jgi:N-acetylmuramoyl-L-alanine amidase
VSAPNKTVFGRDQADAESGREPGADHSGRHLPVLLGAVNGISRAAVRQVAVVLASAVGLAACSGTAASSHPIARNQSAPRTTAAARTTTAVRTGVLAITASAITTTQSAAPPLAGKVVGIDPGHNGRNDTAPAFIDHQIWNGREYENCNTTGTETDSGYPEARYNWNVATYLSADLRAEGAKIVLTRHSNDGIGPCVNTRAEIIDHAHANVAIDIHADGGPPDGRGFAILEPVADGINNKIIGASKRFGLELRARYLAVTHMPESTYDGVDGIDFRDNLAGLNLTTVPEVLIEGGNMRNTTDAALLVTTAFQQRAAKAMAEAITEFLTGRA